MVVEELAAGAGGGGDGCWGVGLEKQAGDEGQLAAQNAGCGKEAAITLCKSKHSERSDTGLIHAGEGSTSHISFPSCLDWTPFSCCCISVLQDVARVQIV